MSHYTAQIYQTIKCKHLCKRKNC